jgi:hypothetical protein
MALRYNIYVVDTPCGQSQTFTAREAARRFARRLLGRRPSWSSVTVARLKLSADARSIVAVPVEEVVR